MPDRKNPEDVEPAKTGVKLKRKNPTPPKEQTRPQVVPNIAKDSPSGELPTPTEDAIKISTQLNMARQRLVKSMKDFNQLLSSGVLPQNYSVSDKDKEQAVIVELVSAATEIDRISGGEGALALSVFAVRQAIFFRDAGNKLAYKIEKVEEKLAELEKNNILENSNELIKQQQVLELAKKLGVKIKLGSDE